VAANPDWKGLARLQVILGDRGWSGLCRGRVVRLSPRSLHLTMSPGSKGNCWCVAHRKTQARTQVGLPGCNLEHSGPRSGDFRSGGGHQHLVQAATLLLSHSPVWRQPPRVQVTSGSVCPLTSLAEEAVGSPAQPPISQEGTLHGTLRDWTCTSKPLGWGWNVKNIPSVRRRTSPLITPIEWGSCRPQGLYGVDAQKSPRTRPARDSRALEPGQGHVAQQVVLHGLL
jgi:hypothetical protein